jgi:hypothetical protein
MTEPNPQPGDTLQGVRIQNHQKLYDAEPGAYLLTHDRDDGTPNLWFKDPAGHVGRISGAKHTITEEDDGTITVSPSILATQADHGHDWHGYLEHGTWRTV